MGLKCSLNLFQIKVSMILSVSLVLVARMAAGSVSGRSLSVSECG